MSDSKRARLFCSVVLITELDLSWYRETGSPSQLRHVITKHILCSPVELLKLSVPSVVYAVQNNMAFLALSNLDAAVYQVWTEDRVCVAKQATHSNVRLCCLQHERRWPTSWRSRARPCVQCWCWTARWVGCSGSLCSCSAGAWHSSNGSLLKPLKSRWVAV